MLILRLSTALLVSIAWVNGLSAVDKPSRGSSTKSEADRVDCLPNNPGKDESSCQAAGCIWEPTASDAPDCFLPDFYGYRMVGPLHDLEDGFAADLEKISNITMFGGDFNELTVKFEMQTETRLRVKIFPKNTERYEVPVKVPGGSGVEKSERLYEVKVKEEPVFSFQVLRVSSQTVVFDSSLGGLTIADQFLQIAARLPSNNIYGFGEQEQPSLRHDMNWKTWSMFARDRAPDGPGNLYGVHPHYTVLEDDGNTHGVLILNSNAQEVTMTPGPGLVYRTTGGILDMYFFMGPSPEAVVSQYTEAIGSYYVPPYWSLGFHLCRWGYNSLTNMEAAWKRTIDAGIPFDVQWGDIDYMDRVLDFTINPTEFADLPRFVDLLHSLGMKFVPILDPCITTGEPEGSYPPYDDGTKLDVWMKDAQGKPVFAKVWPADLCHFPDFSNPVTQDWWVDQLERFYERVNFDGIWIDMNEPANFEEGSIGGCANNTWNYPPFKPSTDGNTLLVKTVCLDSVQKFGRHYDTHSLYGWSESEPTLRGVRAATRKRGMVLSRSTFVGSGKWAAHWLGDNFSEWDNLYYSIIGILQFNQFGYPLVGADICGFIGNTTEELCARWHQLGAFYPFTRNHNTLGAIDQDPGVWEGGLVARVARDALRIKYTLLPYIYSLFYKHTLMGTTVARPVWHEFPTNNQTWGIDTQFLLGPAFMVSPILKQGQSKRQVYLPEESVWYNSLGQPEQSGYITVQSDLKNENETTPVHYRGGHVIPLQNSFPYRNTVEQRNSNKYILLVLLDRDGKAVGDLYLDDGESINDDNLHTKLVFIADSGMLTSRVEVNDYADAKKNRFEEVIVCGVDTEVSQVTVNNDMNVEFKYSAENKVLEIFMPHNSITESLTIHWF